MLRYAFGVAITCGSLIVCALPAVAEDSVTPTHQGSSLGLVAQKRESQVAHYFQSKGSGKKPYTIQCKRSSNGWTCYLKGDLPAWATNVTIENSYENGVGIATITDSDMQAAIEPLVRRAVGQLELPKPAIKLGPDPRANEWDMAVVGYPLWMWTADGDTVSRTVTEQGIQIDLSATRDRVVFDFGDGTSQVCTSMTPLPASFTPGAASPDCGHTYQHASLPAGSYTVSATAYWTFHWSALGYSGTLPGHVAATRRVPVGELQSVLVTGR